MRTEEEFFLSLDNDQRQMWENDTDNRKHREYVASLEVIVEMVYLMHKESELDGIKALIRPLLKK